MSGSEKELSVVIPVYKTKISLLNRCIESILNQDVEDRPYEIIVVVDGEKENEDILLGCSILQDEHIRVICQPHGGEAAARNNGIDSAKGKWLVFVDADDYLPVGSLHSMIEVAEKENADIVVGNHSRVYGDNKTGIRYYTEQFVWPSDKSQEFMKHTLSMGSDQGTVWAKLYKTDFIKDSGEYLDRDLVNGVDQEFNVRIVLHSPRIVSIPDDVYSYVYNPSSVVRTFKSQYYDVSMRTVSAIRDDLKSSTLPADSVKRIFDIYCLDRLLMLLMNYVCNPHAPWPYSKRKQVFHAVCRNECLSKALKTIPWSSIESKTRRIIIGFAKFNLFLPIYCACSLRYRQLKK